jgi:hypothetical protein
VRIAVCGGVYSNPYALRAFVTDARRRGAERLYCLGDLGGYGAEPDAIWPVLTEQVLPAAERSWGYYHVYDSSVAALLAAAGLNDSRWPDRDPDIPVRTLYGSPLLPNRVWLTDPALATGAFYAAARAAGITRVMMTDSASLPPARPLMGEGGVPVPELTLSPTGWHWHPALLDAAPLLPAGPDGAVAPVRVARQKLVQEVLEHLHSAGVLAPPRYCVTS